MQIQISVNIVAEFIECAFFPSPVFPPRRNESLFVDTIRMDK